MPTLAPALLALLLLVAACTQGSVEPSPRSAASPDQGSSLPCASAIRTGPLPTWARTGFSPPDQPVPHVMGARGHILGVVFGRPLKAPPAPDHGNKILWVAKEADGQGSASLKIKATLNGSHLTVSRAVAGGPGPSIIDMPRSGCWSFDLSWSRYHDRLTVPYTP